MLSDYLETCWSYFQARFLHTCKASLILAERRKVMLKILFHYLLRHKFEANEIALNYPDDFYFQ